MVDSITEKMAVENDFEIIRKARDNMEKIKNDRRLLRIEIDDIQEQFEKLCEAFMLACDLDAECMKELNSIHDRNDVSYADARTSTSSSKLYSHHPFPQKHRVLGVPCEDTLHCLKNQTSPYKATIQCVGDPVSPFRDTPQCGNDNGPSHKDHDLLNADGNITGESDVFDWSDFIRGDTDNGHVHEFHSDDEVEITSPTRHNEGKLELYCWDKEFCRECEPINKKQEVKHTNQLHKTETQINIRRALEIQQHDEDVVNENLYRMLRETFQQTPTGTVSTESSNDCATYHSSNAESLAERFDMEDMEREIDNFYVMRNQIPRCQKLNSSSNICDTNSSLSGVKIIGNVVKKIDSKDGASLSKHGKKRQHLSKIKTFSQSKLFMKKSINTTC